ncbi:hypothetical protein OG802_03950 [Streptomyces sp. NBC_00704]|uniref:hypothetical protein n=1 Tax=unclassified Streptomyces TaxID=2593676 RepID=UPI002E36215C|nr:hypothetical protein [Streptomyces sp. NBC_00704]
MRERFRRILLEASVVFLDGHVERSYGAVNVIVHQAEAMAVATASRPRPRRR